METDAPGEAWRTTSGAEPGAVKAASPVLNGEDEETGRKALRLVLTQRKMRGFAPRFVCWGISAMDSHQTSDFCECLQLVIYKGDSGLAYEISPMYRGSPL